VDTQTRLKELTMRVFVAGATGAIGKQLVPRLLAAGHEVHGMTRSDSKRAMLSELGALPVVAEQVELVRKRKLPPAGGGGGVWSFIHVADAAGATAAAVEHGSRGVYNIVDDDPAPVAEWLPALAQELGAKKPMLVPRLVGRLFAGDAALVMMTELRGASNAKAKRELGWRPAHRSRPQKPAAA
jgi:nucleoside-diphosphate-sugar epimerase